jgi:hypothetical protein
MAKTSEKASKITLTAFGEAEVERMRQEDAAAHLEPLPPDAPRDIRLLWIANSAGVLGDSFASKQAQLKHWALMIQDARQAQNPADLKECCQLHSIIEKADSVLRRHAIRVFNEARKLLPEATVDAEIIRDPPSTMTPEQLRQVAKEWTRITDAAFLAQNTAPVDTPVTVYEFMRLSCTPMLSGLLRSRGQSLLSAARREEITLPAVEGDWKSGQSKKYRPTALMKAWPEYRKRLPDLPELKGFKP